MLAIPKTCWLPAAAIEMVVVSESPEGVELINEPL
jgi:hypothetical protein